MLIFYQIYGFEIMDKTIIELAVQLGEVLVKKGVKIATAESCTGGGLAQVITEIPGSSAWFDRGFVTYSNHSKIQMLQVSPQTLNKFGAVSKEVVVEMANGALANSDADIAVSVTGIAGPGGGTLEKSVGTVYIGLKMAGKPATFIMLGFTGERTLIREKTIRYALKLANINLRM
jgi:nicotinamide-nucleotide amidase